MSENMHRKLGVFLKRTRTTEGKITIFTSLVACFVLVCIVTLYEVRVPVASADDVATSVTVLNTAPAWTVDAQESTESSTTTPTNVGTTLSFTATATDSSNDNYYLLICKTNGAPTANNGAAPTCNGGISNQWALSASTASGAQATASTSTINTFPFNAESNDWWAWICDNNSTLARCNVASRQGSGTTASPFVINHIPIFHSISNNGPVSPGSSVTWTSGSYDNDSLGGSSDQVRLVVCRIAGFSNGSCSGGNGYATSTLATTNAATSTPFTIPTQDRLYNAFVYIVDEHNLAATSTLHGSNSFFYISNVTPVVSPASISLVDTDNVGNLTLAVPAATSGAFKVQFTVVDDNGCLNASSTNEISSNAINVFRSGISSTSCLVSGDYNSNSCYTNASALFAPYYTCVQDGASCSGASDSDATFTCSFPLWFNADPTDASTPWTAENWLATVRATDDNASSTAFIQASTGNDLTSFLAFDVSTTTVAYGSLQPGETTTPLVANTDLRAVGNVGLDELLYGDTMCTNWSAPDSCDSGGINPASEIPVSSQKFATSSIAYTSSLAYTLTASSATSTLLINVPKTTATSSIQSRNTYWGIAIPATITLAGNYTGQNTLLAAVSAFANW